MMGATALTVFLDCQFERNDCVLSPLLCYREWDERGKARAGRLTLRILQLCKGG